MRVYSLRRDTLTRRFAAPSPGGRGTSRKQFSFTGVSNMLSPSSRVLLLKLCSRLVLTLLLTTTTLSAHDMWIEPTAFFPDAGKIIGVRLRVGQDFLGDPLPHTA